MNIKRKTLICIILLVVIVASALAVGIHQYVTRPQAITQDQFDEALRDELYTQVVVKRNTVTAVDAEGNRFSFKVEDPYAFVETLQQDIENFDLQGITQLVNKLKPQQEESHDHHEH